MSIVDLPKMAAPSGDGVDDSPGNIGIIVKSEGDLEAVDEMTTQGDDGDLRGGEGEGSAPIVKPKKFKHGIIYLGRIPDRMNPSRLRQILVKYGEVGRIFLQPEDDYYREQRKKRGGSRTKVYTEGWVEFKRKKIAKMVSATLHNTRMGVRKRDEYYDELWCLKYLPGFKWTHLRERLEYERQVRQQRGRMELSQAKRETAVYRQNVETGKKLQRLQEKRKKQGRVWIPRNNQFRQKRTEDEIVQENPAKRSGKVTKATLSKLFKKS